MADPRNFLLNSDYPRDKLIYLKTGSATVSSSDVAIAHNLPFIPLVDGIWRKSGTDVWFCFGSGLPTATGADIAVAESDGTNVLLSSAVGNTIAIDYRLIGFVPDESDMEVDAPATAGQGATFLLNSDLNYRKLAKSGMVTVTTSDAVAVPHGLGFLPQVELWWNGNRNDKSTVSKMVDILKHGISPPTSDSAYGQTAYVDESNLYVQCLSPDAPITFYYRIYADESGAAV